MLHYEFYRSLGRTGLKVSPICLGTDNFANPTSDNESREILNYAMEQGINLIDTSNSYADGKAEQIIGKTLQDNNRREDIILATKFYYPTSGRKGVNHRGASRKHIIKACEDSLKRLGTDYIDLYQMHRVAMDMELEEILSALTYLVRQGKIRYFGATTSPSWKIAESRLLSEFKNMAYAVSEQLPYNLLDRRVENEILPACEWANLAVFAWSPLAMGMLAGRYNNSDAATFETARFQRGGIYADRVTPKAVTVAQQFVELAKEVKMKPAHLALLWVKEQPGITAPLCGPRTLEQLKDIVPLMSKGLSKELMERCDQIVPPGSAVANFLNSAPWMKGKLI
ncbi:aldo/keto reductase [Galbibacter sp. PAP.153]|uniref:aldo/keto reductase n=1 Tax=Galbibacter sp. PAP.153 TaxID=3104623 RepID=UPI00300B1CC1